MLIKKANLLIKNIKWGDWLGMAVHRVDTFNEQLFMSNYE